MTPTWEDRYKCRKSGYGFDLTFLSWTVRTLKTYSRRPLVKDLCLLFGHTPPAHDWRRMADLFIKLSTALGPCCGDNMGSTTEEGVEH